MAGAAVAVVFALGVARGGAITDEIVHAVALAAAAVPEGLPAVVTVTLAVGARHLAAGGAIVKRLASVETLGATTVICSDKTGTLTLNQMTVRAVVAGGRRFRVTGEGYRTDGVIEAADGSGADLRPLLTALALCNDSRLDGGTVVGDPMEAALIVLAVKGGVDADAEAARHPRLAELPFDASRRFMATFHAGGHRVLLYAKGAPDVLVPRTSLPPAAQAAIVLAEVERLAGDGLRVLAAASADIPGPAFSPGGDLAGYLHGLRFGGLVGIAVKMITGDHATTAAAIATELGITGEVVTGADLDALDDDALAARIDRISVFARVAPEHKVRIVEALRSRGEVVAMTGDGVNDAPALKRADIGVAMGRTGTAVSREAATMVLTDDNFATVVAAVRRGRAIYDNIATFVRFQLATNVGAITTLVAAVLLGLPRPLDAVHVLWINLITDGPPGVALGVDPPAPDAMARGPRRPSEGILTGRRLRVIVLHGTVMAAGTLAVFSAAGGEGARATTLAFTTFVLFQVVNALNVRHGSIFARHTITNWRLWAALASVVGLQIAAVHVALLNGLFHTTALSAGDWALSAGTALSLLAVEELRVRRARPTPRPPTADVVDAADAADAAGWDLPAHDRRG
ncbi:MAG: HAD-IC family P-type ATPase [Actinomycetota bacterium]